MASRKIRGITIEFGADATGLLKSLSEIEARGRKIKASYQDMNKLLKLDPKNTEILKQKQDELKKAVENTKKELEQLNKMQSHMEANGVSKTSDEYKALRREITDTEQTLKGYEEALERVNVKLNQKAQFIGMVVDKMNAWGTKLQEKGKQIEGVGRSLSLYVTAPLTLIGKKAVDAFMSFEDGLTGVAKTSNMSAQELKLFSNQARDLSKRIPLATTEILKIAEAAGQLGVEDKNIISFTESMAKMGFATNMTAEQAAVTFARFANIMGTSQEKFENLGSSIVDLGNNFATTESEIMDMSLRIAGTGKQVNLTEGDVFGLATALSSLGLEAQAGGSSISRVMQKINTAVIENSDSLVAFANVAGTSADKFAADWKSKPTEALAKFLDGLKGVKDNGANTVGILKELGITAIREVDSVFRLSSNTDLLRKAVEKGNTAFNENIALQVEAEKKNKTLSSRIQMLKNRAMDLGREIGEKLLPYAEKFMEKIKEWIDKFSNLDDGTKEMIVKFGLLAAVLGPILIGVGKLTSGFGGLLKIGGSVFTGASKLVGVIGAKGLGGAVTALSTKLGVIATGAAPVIGIIAGLGVAAYGAYKTFKYFSSDSIEKVDVLSKGVSSKTKEMVGSFLSLEEETKKSLDRLVWSGDVVTKEGVDKISSNFKQMKETITGNLREQKKEAEKTLDEMMVTMGQRAENRFKERYESLKTLSHNERVAIMTDSVSISTEEANEVVRLALESYERRIGEMEAHEARIQEILQTASSEKRALTTEEATEINAIRQIMKDEGIRTLSESEEEYRIIMQRIKDNAGEMSALQAAEVVQNSLTQKEQTIAQAEEEYNERIRIAERLKAQGSEEARQAADTIIAEAKRQRDESIKEAEQMHANVVDEAKKQAGEHVREVDWSTGEIKSKWEIMKQTVSDSITNLGTNLKNGWDSIKRTASEKWDEFKTVASTTWESIKTVVGNKLGEWKTKASETWDGIKRTAGEKWGALKNFASEKWEAIKTSITTPISNAWTTVSGWLGKFKNAFNFKWELPKISLPRVNMWTEPGFLGIPIPKFSISWNRDGGIFKRPTVIPTLEGYQGFAEPSTGGEAIMPLNKLPGLMAEAMEIANQNKNQTIVNYVILDGKVISREITYGVDKNLGIYSDRLDIAGGLL
ncbi:MAG: phage tail tape measure protein [Tissierellia bacterium]|nr:phage tail tape measure protein [Tissierellia bacterium]